MRPLTVEIPEPSGSAKSLIVPISPMIAPPRSPKSPKSPKAAQKQTTHNETKDVDYTISRITQGRFQMNKWTLRFENGVVYESQFLLSTASKMQDIFKGACWLALVFWIIYLVLDILTLDSDVLAPAVTLRVAAGCLLFFWCLVVRKYPRNIEHHQTIATSFIGTLILGIALQNMVSDTFKFGPAAVYIALVLGPLVARIKIFNLYFMYAAITPFFMVISALPKTVTLGQWGASNCTYFVCSIICLLAVYTLESRARLNFVLRYQIQREQEKIRHQKERSDALLLNILPAQITDVLKQSKSIVISDRYEKTTVVFARITGYDSMRNDGDINAEEVVLRLNKVVCAFDLLCGQYGVEKIKTMGSTFMAIAGAPDNCKDHAIRAARFAIAMQATLEDTAIQLKLPLTAKIGLHSGPCVAGVIGTSKFSYDVWGDTVNMASRMMSSGEHGCIQISEATFDQLIGHSEFVLSAKGEKEVKGKGLVPVYQLDCVTKSNQDLKRGSTFLDEADESLMRDVENGEARDGGESPTQPKMAPVYRQQSSAALLLMHSGSEGSMGGTDNMSRESSYRDGSVPNNASRLTRASGTTQTQLTSVPELMPRRDHHPYVPSGLTSEPATPRSPRSILSPPPPLLGVVSPPMSRANSSALLEEGAAAFPELFDIDHDFYLTRFSKRFRDKELETEYARFAYMHGLKLIRGYATWGAVLFVSFYFVDSWNDKGDPALSSFVIRLLGAVAVAMFLLLSTRDWFYRHAGTIVTALLLYGQLPPPYLIFSGADYAFAAQRLCLTYLYTQAVPIVHPINLTVVCIIGNMAWLVAESTHGDMPMWQILDILLITTCCIMFGHLTSHLQNMSSRLDFILLTRYRMESQRSQEQRQLNEALLCNIFPRRIAKRLISRPNSQISERFPNAAVLFCDIVGFTKLASELEPGRVVSLLNTLFTGFDHAAYSLRIEKIKTIGDGYMVAGLPVGAIDPAKGIAEMALRMHRHLKSMKLQSGFPDFDIRIGINLGPVLGGVIGVQKFIYDIFGPDVDLANKIEAKGVSGRIHCSESFYEACKDHYDFVLRKDTISIHNQPVKTYFLLGRKSGCDLPLYLQQPSLSTDSLLGSASREELPKFELLQ